MMGAVLLDADYRPVRPAIIWADTRSSAADRSAGVRHRPGPRLLAARPPAQPHLLAREDHVGARQRTRRLRPRAALLRRQGLRHPPAHRAPRHRPVGCLGHERLRPGPRPVVARHARRRRPRRRAVPRDPRIDGDRRRADLGCGERHRAAPHHPRRDGRRRRPDRRGRRRHRRPRGRRLRLPRHLVVDLLRQRHPGVRPADAHHDLRQRRAGQLRAHRDDAGRRRRPRLGRRTPQPPPVERRAVRSRRRRVHGGRRDAADSTSSPTCSASVPRTGTRMPPARSSGSAGTTAGPR